jgi:hypothetical protein
VLDALRNELRKLGLLPVLFDFDQPSNRTTVETVATLAGIARFVIADITDPKACYRNFKKLFRAAHLPVQPILRAGETEAPMFDFFRMYPWVLATQYYDTSGDLLKNLTDQVIGPAERKAAEQIALRRKS